MPKNRSKARKAWHNRQTAIIKRYWQLSAEEKLLMAIFGENLFHANPKPGTEDEKLSRRN